MNKINNFLRYFLGEHDTVIYRRDVQTDAFNVNVIQRFISTTVPYVVLLFACATILLWSHKTDIYIGIIRVNDLMDNIIMIPKYNWVRINIYIYIYLDDSKCGCIINYALYLIE